MGDNRQVYGSAYGFANNWYALVQGGTAHTLGQADTTPDVTNGTLWYSINSAATTITHFDMQTAGGNSQPGLFEGKCIKILFTDANTTLADGPQLALSGTGNVTFAANGYIGLLYHNSAWIETERSGGVQPAQARTVTIAGTNSAIDILDTDRILVVTGTIAATTVSGLSGGYIGQQLTVVQGSGGASIYLPYGNNIYYQGTANFLISGTNSDNATNSVIATKVSATAWSINGGKIAIT